MALIGSTAYAINTASSMVPSATGMGFPFIFPASEQNVAYSSVSVTTSSVGSKTSVVRLVCSTDCFIKMATVAGSAGVSTNSATILKAGIEYYFGVIPSTPVAVIRSSADGNLYLSEGR